MLPDETRKYGHPERQDRPFHWQSEATNKYEACLWMTGMAYYPRPSAIAGVDDTIGNGGRRENVVVGRGSPLLCSGERVKSVDVPVI